jgi:hypothetical protein
MFHTSSIDTSTLMRIFGSASWNKAGIETNCSPAATHPRRELLQFLLVLLPVTVASSSPSKLLGVAPHHRRELLRAAPHHRRELLPVLLPIRTPWTSCSCRSPSRVAGDLNQSPLYSSSPKKENGCLLSLEIALGHTCTSTTTDRLVLGGATTRREAVALAIIR